VKVDLLITDAEFLTQDPARPVAHTAAVLGDRIIALDADCQGLRPRRTVRADGAVIVPGFNDAHAHSVWFGTSLLEEDLSTCQSLPGLYEQVADHARAKAPGEWVVASGFNQMDTGGEYPDPSELDRASGGRPVWIKHTSGHACIVSAAAMRALAITGSERFEGGRVVVDEQGTPTGVLEETAMALVHDYMLPLSDRDIVEALAAAHRVYAAEGLTSVTDAGIAGGWIGHSPAELGAYQAARQEGALAARTQVMIASDVLTDIAAGEETFHGLPTGMRSGFGDDRLSLGPVKIFLDGSILGNTARMSAGYTNCPTNHGYFQADPELMRTRAVRAAKSGWALAMHAVGDEAIDLAIAILTEVRGIPPPLPHRIEHGGVVTPEQLETLADLGATIVSQPHFMRAYGDGFRGYIGDERTHWSFRSASQLRAGMALAGSSDRPVAPGAPLEVMTSAIHRQTNSGWVYGPEERLTPTEALRAYTAGSAHVTGWAGQKGVIAPGYLADFAVLDASPLDGDPNQRRVLSTLVGGEVVFDESRLWEGTVGR